MANSYLEDYTRYRTTVSGWDSHRATVSGIPGFGLYSVDEKIGRRDYIKVKVTAEYATEYGGTVSGTQGTILV